MTHPNQPAGAVSDSDEMHFNAVFEESDSEDSYDCEEGFHSLKEDDTYEDVPFSPDEEGMCSVSFKQTSCEVFERMHSPRSRKVNLEDFEVLRLVGKGAYGKVHQVQKKDSGEFFAMKVMKKRFLIKTNNVSYTLTEREILRNILHPFIASLHFAFQNHGKVYLVMDFLNGGHLLHHMRKQAMICEDYVKVYAAELVLALEYLHSLNIIHRDIKPENILLSHDGHLCLTDFGLAKVDVVDETSRTFCGTMEYMAPEIIKGEGHGKAVDLWSLGILIYDMLTGDCPFKAKQRNVLQKKIIKGKFKLPPYLSAASHSIIKGLLQTDPSKRLGVESMEDIKKHKFFTGINWEKVHNKEVPPPIPLDLEGPTDIKYFDKKYTKVKPGDSPTEECGLLSNSQDACFLGFSYVRMPSDTVWTASTTPSRDSNDYDEPDEVEICD